MRPGFQSEAVTALALLLKIITDIVMAANIKADAVTTFRVFFIILSPQRPFCLSFRLWRPSILLFARFRLAVNWLER